MSILELDVKLPELDGLVKDLGLEEGGRAQQHLVKNVARRITKYVPKRTYSSIENAIAQGQEPHRHSRPAGQVPVLRKSHGRAQAETRYKQRYPVHYHVQPSCRSFLA